MRPAPNRKIEAMRHTAFEITEWGQTCIGMNRGAFATRRKGCFLRIIASDGLPEQGAPPHWLGWEHVSMSLEHRCPTWEEMCFAKELFWEDEETVMQLHPPRSEWVSYHPYTLHLWRPLNIEIPRPPMILVGPQEKGPGYQQR